MITITSQNVHELPKSFGELVISSPCFMKSTIQELSFDPLEKLKSLTTAYKHMPNGGALLHLSGDGQIDNGLCIICKFPSRHSAKKALWQLGFRELSSGWKILA